MARFLAALRRANAQLLEDPLDTILELLEDASSGSVGAISEVICIAARHGLQLIGSAALIGADSVGIKVRLQL